LRTGVILTLPTLIVTVDALLELMDTTADTAVTVDALEVTLLVLLVVEVVDSLVVDVVDSLVVEVVDSLVVEVVDSLEVVDDLEVVLDFRLELEVVFLPMRMFCQVPVLPFHVYDGAGL